MTTGRINQVAVLLNRLHSCFTTNADTLNRQNLSTTASLSWPDNRRLCPPVNVTALRKACWPIARIAKPTQTPYCSTGCVANLTIAVRQPRRLTWRSGSAYRLTRRATSSVTRVRGERPLLGGRPTALSLPQLSERDQLFPFQKSPFSLTRVQMTKVERESICLSKFFSL